MLLGDSVTAEDVPENWMLPTELKLRTLAGDRNPLLALETTAGIVPPSSANRRCNISFNVEEVDASASSLGIGGGFTVGGAPAVDMSAVAC
jgi:hypothetical protein